LLVTVDDGSEDAGEIAVRFDVVQFAGLDERRDHSPVLRTGIMTGKERVFALSGQFPFILPMSGQFIACSIGGTRILVPMLRSIDPIGAAMGRMWGLSGIASLR
jgi:hypothetical protein